MYLTPMQYPILIKADGITDDLPALVAAYNYCAKMGIDLYLPPGVIRIGSTWIIGGRLYNEADVFMSAPLQKAKSASAAGLNLSKFTRPIRIIGTPSTCIWGDFVPTQLQAIIYYSCQGVERNTQTGLMAGGIEGLGVYAQPYFKNGKPTTLAEDYSGNNQVGIFCTYTDNMAINKVTVHGCKYGVIMNNSYRSQLSNLIMNYCTNALYHLESHGGNWGNIISYMCKRGPELASGKVTVNNLNSEYCETGLIVSCGGNVLNTVYLENTKCKSGVPQMIIGSTVPMREATIFNAITIGASCSAGYATGVEWLPNAGKTIFVGGNMPALLYKYQTGVKILNVGCEAVFPKEIVTVIF